MFLKEVTEINAQQGCIYLIKNKKHQNCVQYFNPFIFLICI